MHLRFQESLENQLNRLLVHNLDKRLTVEFTAPDSVGEKLFDLKSQKQIVTYAFVAGEENEISRAFRAFTKHLHGEAGECKAILLVKNRAEAVAYNLCEEVVSESKVRVIEPSVVDEHESLHQSSQHILVGRFESGLTFEEFASHRGTTAQLLADAEALLENRSNHGQLACIARVE